MKKIKKIAAIAAVSVFTLLAADILAGIILSKEKNEVVMRSSAFKDYPQSYLEEFFAEMNELDEKGAQWNHFGCWKYFPHRGKLINVDASGRRVTRNACDDAAADTVTVFMFGGSTLWGEAARDTATIASFLSGLLNASPHCAGNFFIVNYGQPGFVTSQEIITLERELRSGNIPDYVLFYDGMNDVHAAHINALHGLAPCLPPNEMHRVEEFFLSQESGRMLAAVAKNRLANSYLLSLFRKEHTDGSEFRQSDIGMLSRQVVECYRGNLRILKALSEEFGFGYHAFLQPVLFTKKQKLDDESQLAAQYDSMFKAAYEAVYAALEGDTATASFTNLSNAFDRHESPLYYDVCHTNETGNRIVASAMFEAVRQDLCRQAE